MHIIFDSKGRLDRGTARGRAAITLAHGLMAARDRLTWLDVYYRINLRPKIPSIILRGSDKVKRTVKGIH